LQALVKENNDQTRLVVLDSTSSAHVTKKSILNGKIETSVTDFDPSSIVVRRRSMSFRIPPCDDSNEKYKLIIAMTWKKKIGVKAICLFQMSDCPELQEGNLLHVWQFSMNVARTLSQSFDAFHFIFEIDPKWFQEEKITQFCTQFKDWLLKDKKINVAIEITFSSDVEVIGNILKSITKEEDEDKFDNTIDDVNFAAALRLHDSIESDVLKVLESTLCAKFPYVNPISILVLIERVVFDNKTLQKSCFSNKEDLKKIEKVCGCPIGCFQKTQESLDTECERNKEAKRTEKENEMIENAYNNGFGF
jgi:hypothetical protein